MAAFGVKRAADAIEPTVAHFCEFHGIECAPLAVDGALLDVAFALAGAVLGGLLFAPAVRWVRRTNATIPVRWPRSEHMLVATR
eukprot:scaffold1847_cov343-Prasinococcus_capsulatus_cf.AAC.12